MKLENRSMCLVGYRIKGDMPMTFYLLTTCEWFKQKRCELWEDNVTWEYWEIDAQKEPASYRRLNKLLNVVTSILKYLYIDSRMQMTFSTPIFTKPGIELGTRYIVNWKHSSYVLKVDRKPWNKPEWKPTLLRIPGPNVSMPY